MTTFLNRPEGQLAYELRGEKNTGPLVVCVPGMGELRSQYRALAPLLVAAGYRVALLDIRGHGESAATFTDYSAAAIGTDIVALIAALGNEPAIVVGNSMAAGSAVFAAATSNAPIRALAITGPFVRDVPQTRVQKFAMWMMLALMMRGPWGPAAWGMFYATLYPVHPPKDLAEHRAKIVADLKLPGHFAALRAMLQASKADCEARIPSVSGRVPVLTIMGTRDPDFADPAAEARFIHERLPGALLMVNDAGHYPHVEEPQLVADAIVELVGASSSGTKQSA